MQPAQPKPISAPPSARVTSPDSAGVVSARPKRASTRTREVAPKRSKRSTATTPAPAETKQLTPPCTLKKRNRYKVCPPSVRYPKTPAAEVALATGSAVRPIGTPPSSTVAITPGPLASDAAMPPQPAAAAGVSPAQSSQELLQHDSPMSEPAGLTAMPAATVAAIDHGMVPPPELR